MEKTIHKPIPNYKTALVIVFLIMLYVLTSCSGNKPVLPTWEQMTCIKMQEYQGDVPISMEISQDYNYDPHSSVFPDGTYFYNPKNCDYKQITNVKKMPVRDISIRFQFTDKNDQITTVYVFSDEKYNYLEIPGQGTWREEIPKHLMSEQKQQTDLYRDTEFRQAFTERAVTREFSLIDNYNSAGKAVFIDLDKDELDTGFSEWWNRYIPNDRKAERPEDVRYVILKEMINKDYKGYWYNSKTGEKMEDAYDCTYRITAFDLVTGEQEVRGEYLNVLASTESETMIDNWLASKP